MKQNWKTAVYTGWLLPFLFAATFMGLWIVDIVVPTLKGGNFNALYDLNKIRYLDISLGATIIGFTWLSYVVIRIAKKEYCSSTHDSLPHSDRDSTKTLRWR